MRKVIVSMNMTLDGFLSGPDRELDWHFSSWNEEMARAASEQLGKADTILLGRLTYQAMAGYWPARGADPSTPREDIDFAEMMNCHTKIVFSKTLKKLEWINSRLAQREMAAEIGWLKQQPGKDMITYGSALLASALLRSGLVDECRIWVHPVVLGKGKSLFGGLAGQIKLELFRAQEFSSGVVLLFYKTQSQKIMNAKILTEIENSSGEFVKLISSFSLEQINQVPYEGSWTPGQVAEHVIRSVSGVLHALNGKVKPADRPADQYTGPIRAMFLDFTTKMNSPEFTIPENIIYLKENLVLDLEKGMASVAETIRTADLDEICLAFEFPGFGFLTRLEWVCFTLVHTQRHIHQLSKISRALTQEAPRTAK